MGMFDNIRCEVPLPDGWTPSELQTKDFGCELVCHVISKEGRLLLDNGHNEEVPKEERPYPNAEPGTWESLCGILRRVPKLEDANFHGVVNFYGTEIIGYEPPQTGDQFRRPVYKWHEYNAKFTDGQLVGIVVVPDDALSEG